MSNNRIIIYSVIAFAILISVVSSCNSENTRNKQNDSENKIAASAEGMELMEKNCFSCHNPDMEIEHRLAPPMFKIREHYYDSNITKKDFTTQIINFINSPTEENSIMPGAVRNFGLMPKQTFKQEELKIIASYIYENDLGSDQWYDEWEKHAKAKTKNELDSGYEYLGQKIANNTKAQLGKNLQKALQFQGASGAIEFCNTRAIPLTDSMAIVSEAKVKRVSDQPRNPQNNANRIELEIIKAFKKRNINSDNLSAQMIENNETVTGYYPIMTNQMCLQCHGNKNENILPETETKINSLYPLDKAFGYKENELRGLFVVEMKKKKQNKNEY